MGHLRRPSGHREPVRSVDAVVVGRAQESTPVRVDRVEQPPVDVAQREPIEQWVAEEREFADEIADPDDDEVLEDDVAAQLQPAAVVDDEERVIVAKPAEHYAVYDDEDVEEVVPATVDGTTCRINVWRGYRKATFYAQAFDSRGEEVALAESPAFRYRGNGMPEQTEAAAEAHRALLEALRHSGYQTARRGTSWFDVTLTRR